MSGQGAHVTPPIWVQLLTASAPAFIVLVGVVLTLQATASRERRLRLLDRRHDAYLEYQLALDGMSAQSAQWEYDNPMERGFPSGLEGVFVDAPLREELVKVSVYGSAQVQSLAERAQRMMYAAADDDDAYDKAVLDALLEAMRRDLGAGRWQEWWSRRG